MKITRSPIYGVAKVVLAATINVNDHCHRRFCKRPSNGFWRAAPASGP